MARLIDADKLLLKAVAVSNSKGQVTWSAVATTDILAAPTVDAVLRGVYDQCAWERNVALEQLHDVGLSWGEKTDDVVEVVRCKNCKHWHHSGYCKLIGMAVDRGHNDYCSYGERKDNERKNH